MRLQYDGFEHLCDLLESRSGDYVVIVQPIEAYFDDSASDQANRVAVIGGYIAPVSEWRAFRTKWRRVLKKPKYNVPVEQMRRSDLENYKGAFIKWRQPLRDAFLTELHPIIRRHTYVGIAQAVIKSDWEDVMPGRLKRLFGGPCGWCAHVCVTAVGGWCIEPEHQYDGRISWTFESGTQNTGEIMTMFAEVAKDPTLRRAFHIYDPNNDLVFAGKNVVPLHAADFIAYEVFKQIENQILNRGQFHNVRFSIRDMLRQRDIPHLHYWDRARLQEWLDKWQAQNYPLTAVRHGR